MRCTLKPVHWVILCVVLVTVIVLSGCTSNSPLSQNPVTPTTTPIQLSATPIVNIQNFAFTPAVIPIPAGTTVTWINMDTADHTVVSDTQGSTAQGALFSSPSLPKGASYSFKFDKTGTYTYHCSIHPSMKGTVVVT